MIVSAAPQSIVIVNGLLLVAPTLSVTIAVKVKVPARVGVPVILPSELRVSPGGRVPEDDHAYGEVPPDADTCAEYGLPRVPLGSGLELVMTRELFTCWVNGTVITWGVGQESVAEMLKVYAPAVVGLPLSIPPDDSEVPVGMPPPGLVHVIEPDPPEERN